MIVAVVMALQRIEECSDREAVERFTFDARWKSVAGGRGFDHPGFVYDAVATIDTVTLVRSAICGLLRVCEQELESELRGLLARDADYRAAGKPVCDYDDPAAREDLIDALARDARAVLCADCRERSAEVAKAAALMASVVGQDLDEGDDGIFRIVSEGPDHLHGGPRRAARAQDLGAWV